MVHTQDVRVSTVETERHFQIIQHWARSLNLAQLDSAVVGHNEARVMTLTPQLETQLSHDVGDVPRSEKWRRF